MRLSSELCGYYIPSFFFMFIDTDEDLSNLNNLSIKSRKTLIHEYTHFLQDITTVYGIARISQTVRLIAMKATNILNSKSFEFTFPIKDYLTNPQREDIAINTDLFSLYDGNIKIKDTLVDVIKVYPQENGMIEGYEREPEVIVEYRNQKGEIKEFHFGAWGIMESMTAEIENYLYNETNFPNFPYRVVELILDKLYPELLTDRQNIIRISDISLGSFNPAKSFMNIVEVMKQNNIVPKSYKEASDFVRSFLVPCDSKYKDYFDVFFNLHNTIKGDFANIFTTNDVKSLADWANNLLEIGKQLRHINWVNSVLTLQPQQAIGYYRSLINTTGLPTFSNNLNHYFIQEFSPDFNEKASLLRAVLEVNNLLNGNISGCQMREFCKQKPTGDITDDNCSKPWERAKYEKKCPFTQLWIMWGLQNYYPKC